MDLELIEEQNRLTCTQVTEKYNHAANIANEALRRAFILSKPGVSVNSICSSVNTWILEQVQGLNYRESGIAFPCCVTLNNMIQHFCPSKDEDVTLQVNDCLKIELGVHIDGYIATTATTLIINPSPSEPVTGKAADATCAAFYASEAALKLIKPGNTSKMIAETLKGIVANFGCSFVSGSMISEQKRFVLDGRKVIALNEESEEEQEEFTIESGDVYSINILVASGESNATHADCKVHVMQRNVHQKYSLKLNTSRQIYKEIDSKFSVFPFAVASLEDVNKARLGLSECLQHNVIIPLPVLNVKRKETVAQFKNTVLVTDSETVNITRKDNIQIPYVHSIYGVEEKFLSIFNQ
ncbi:Peptidase M24, structural domain-containing protein [Rozella allomycis CSF55]|uniref:Probable metalloprotease ARX1 n=1 Tax=Rozella allomycis (strain CSF55) TaxID=988480 RepID=A0A075B4E1_ROZAC|nr:Peptidase M24, structural domain-containing protein [Rozella allomycis CSF55]|eukprot:EPZ36270.1 Peptidase M24, structural domain-containing protein [Rozella allomycis CSF55]